MKLARPCDTSTNLPNTKAIGLKGLFLALLTDSANFINNFRLFLRIRPSIKNKDKMKNAVQTI